VEKDDNELGVVNEELRARLQEWRTARFKKDNVPAFKIMHQSTLMAIATHIPKTKSELLRIKGFGEESFKKYGEDILAITAEFTL
jgi:DNA helicase-2/ATP-dependent DNA helicase PcrA